MSQVAPRFTPQQSQDAGHRAETDGTADATTLFYQQLYDESDAEPEPVEVGEGMGDMPSNVFPLGIWQKGPAHPHQVAHAAHHVAHPVRIEPRLARPRNGRRARQPVPPNHYPTGQVIATLFAALGWLMVGAGLAVSLISFLLPGLSVRFGLPHLLGGAAGALFVGLLTVALGLAARAMFDQASAARELFAMQRARLGPEQY